MIGRVDLVDVLTMEEYEDTIPEILRERTKASYQFVLRNPQTLDMPIRMVGQPSIYKMPKEILLGAKPLLKRAQYAWWPPKEYRLVSIGQFDLYPNNWDSKKLKRLVSTSEEEQELGIDVPKVVSQDRKTEVVKTNNAVYMVKDFISLKYQQVILDSIRDLCTS